ncbi:hypothetical protein JNO63_08540 [Anaerococcus sp. mt242]|uniref:hypothetical protein n=1 Tax=Anaerococcus sp. mt242 TaxID=2661917 RepID=UPI001933CF16|nr:hypothetical protein [Anaerococcus sp. mt242]MBM0047122.1 hypothetical protein [Anaerococcus sp. mt242]
MIKVFNKKPIGEINELREKGLYNAPFSVQENANPTKIETPDTKALEDKIQKLEGKITELESKDNATDPYDDSELLKKIEELEAKLAESEQTVADYASKTESQAKTIEDLNADLDALVGGIDE